MPFFKFETDVLNVSALLDKPTQSASELKAVFDKAGVDIKSFLNDGPNNIFFQLEAPTAATNLGISPVSGLTGTTIGAVLSNLASRLQSTTPATSGANFVKISTIATITATDVQTALAALATKVAALEADGSVTTPKIANNAVTTAKIADLNVTTAKLADSSVTGAKIANGTISQIELDGTLSGKIDTIATNTAAISTVANDLTIHKSSGDHDGRYYTKTLLDGGQLDNRYHTKTYIDAKVSTDYGAIATINNVSNSAGNVNLTGGTGISISANDADNIITITATGTATPGLHAVTHEAGGTDELLPNSISTNMLQDLAVSNEKLDENAVETFNIADLNVTTEKIADLSITTGKIANTAIIESKIADNAITANKIASMAVTNDKIETLAVTNAKINDVDASKLTGTVNNARLTSATTSTAGIVQLNNTLTSTSTTLALTANQGKQLQDTKLNLSGGTLTGDLTIGNTTINGISGGITQIGTPAFLNISPYSIFYMGRTTNNSGFQLQIFKGDNTASTSHILKGIGDSYLSLNGNIGVGTATPTQRLDVNGTIKSTGLDISGNSILSGTSAQSALFNYGATRTISVKQFDANNLVLDTSQNDYNYIGTDTKRFWRGYFNTVVANTISGSSYTGLPIASTSVSGIVSTGTQTIAGSKTFTSSLQTNGNFLCNAPTTTSSGANVNFTLVNGLSLYEIRRSTSARKYKTDEQILDTGLKALELQPKSWLDKNEIEEIGIENSKRYIGFIAEDLIEIGLSEFVVFNDSGEPDSISYDRLVASLIPVLKQQEERIKKLEGVVANG